MFSLLIPLFVFLAFVSAGWTVYPAVEGYFLAWQRKRVERITPKLDRIFITIPYRKLLLLDVASPLSVGILAYILTHTFWMAVAAGFAGLVIPNFIVKQLEASRKIKFATQLVDGLMLLSGSLKAGLSLLQAFEALVEEMPVPISQEFSLVVRENRMGIPLEECLYKFRQRMGSEELDMIVTAVLVARETGGDLTVIFSNLVMTIRERNRLLGRVKALCVQGKLQGRIMMVIPVIFAYGLYKINPSIFEVLLNDPQGRALLIYAAISEVIGAIMITRFSKIEI